MPRDAERVDVWIADKDARRRLNLTWSRSSRRLIVGVDNIAQALLDSEQQDVFTKFLSQSADLPAAERPGHGAIRLRDEDDDVGRQLDARWSRSGQRLVLTVRPTLDGRKDAREVELPIDQVKALENFLLSSRS